MEKNRLIVAAMDIEVQLVRSLGFYGPVLVGGIGAEMVRSLRTLPRDTPLMNIGYAGSNLYPIGSRHEIAQSWMLSGDRMQFGDRVYHLRRSTSDGAICLTAPDFVTESIEVIPVLYDMELALILNDGFCDVRAIKVVSDNLDMNQYERYIDRENEDIR